MFLAIRDYKHCVWPELNFGLEWTTFGRLRPLHTNAVIFAFGGCALMATSLYVVQRTDCARMAVADDIDPAYAAAFARARAAGVEAVAHAARITPQGVSIGSALPVEG